MDAVASGGGWPSAQLKLAAVYRTALADVQTGLVIPPERDPGHVYHLFPVLSEQRDAVRERLRSQGIETLIHYPVPIPRQPALASERPAMCPVADRVCDRVFSLPLHQGMTRDTVLTIASALRT